MGTLIVFELKKLISRRTAQVAGIGMLLLICLIMALNVIQQHTWMSVGEQLSGTAAIAQAKARAEIHAGVITPERVRADVDAWREAAYANVSPDELADVDMSQAYALMEEAHSEDELVNLYNDYYSWLFYPWKQPSKELCQYADGVTNEQIADYYGQVRNCVEGKLLQGTESWTYSQPEIDYWMGKQANVTTPFEYGYAGGWEDILDCLGFAMLIMLTVCIVVAPSFTAEYADRTDAVVLATKHGRQRLAGAKVLAALIFATAYFALCAAVVIGVPLIFFGADGANLPLQAIVSVSAYDLTASQAVWVGIGLAYLMTIGFTALTLLLSSKMRSTMGIFAIVVVLLVMTGVIGGFNNGIYIHIRQLFPMNALSANLLFYTYESYPFGPVVLDLQTMLVIVYAAVTALCVPFAIRAFKRHQVL